MLTLSQPKRMKEFTVMFNSQNREFLWGTEIKLLTMECINLLRKGTFNIMVKPFVPSMEHLNPIMTSVLNTFTTLTVNSQDSKILFYYPKTL